MRYNTFSYISVSLEQQLAEFESLGFALSPNLSDKENLECFVRRVQSFRTSSDWILGQMIADWDTDLATFFQSNKKLTADVFYHVAFQLLGFFPFFDYTDVRNFVEQTAFPIAYGAIIDNLYQLLNLRTKTGNSLIDQLVSDGLIPEDNKSFFFNGKALATFDTKNLIREVVYVETPVDTDKDGKTDLIKVSIVRPDVPQKIPALLTQNPYHQGVNDVASDKALHKMEGELLLKEPQTLIISHTPTIHLETSPITDEHHPASEQTGHISSYTLNDYMLARGVASIYAAGIGTFNSEGFMTSGDDQQVAAYKAVVDWLNGRAVAFTDHSRQHQTKATWATGKVATTGLSYLGTLSNALATTGVDGLEVIIAEAGISSWYNYYRENGLVTSPGGYPGEDLDNLAAFTYSKALQAGDWLRNKEFYQQEIAAMTASIDRQTGNYNDFWQARNYLPDAGNVRCEVVFTHGTQDWNVKPIHVYQMFHALPNTVSKHLFLHHGAHIYMNNWQSIDFRESMNALLSQKLLGLDNGYTLPNVIWQDNQTEQKWQILEDFAGKNQLILPLGTSTETIANRYEEDQFAAYGKAYSTFHTDLFAGNANQVAVDLVLDRDICLNGRAKLRLRVQSSTNKGLLSAQILDWGAKKRLTPIPAMIGRLSLDNGRYHSLENLMELPFADTPHRVVTKSHLNLQHRTDLLTIESVPAEEWLDVTWELQPTIYQFKQGDCLRVIFYTTDFETTIRDNGDWKISIDLSQSSLTLPVE